MHDVATFGTAARAKIEGIDICAKTGTAQNPHGKNHSLFVAFAPRENPKIAICVVVENAGYGATWAAPIAFADDGEIPERFYLFSKVA
jgi:penicillin-binding protein 2